MSKIKTLTLFYRCAGNYKTTFPFDVPESVLVDKEITEGSEIEVEDIGLSVYEMCKIIGQGYDPDLDHNFVTVEKIKDQEEVMAEV